MQFSDDQICPFFSASANEEATTVDKALTCKQKRGTCETCGKFPLCLECVCRGPRRGPSTVCVTVRVLSQRESAARALHELAIQFDGESDDEECTDQVLLFTAAILMDRFRLSARAKGEIPTRNHLGSSMYALFTFSQEDTLSRVMDRIDRAGAIIFVPNDAASFQTALRMKKVTDGKLGQSMVACIRAAKKGSVERYVLRGMLCVTTTGHEIRLFLSNSSFNGIMGSRNDMDADGSDKNDYVTPAGTADDAEEYNAAVPSQTGPCVRQRTGGDRHVTTGTVLAIKHLRQGGSVEGPSKTERVNGYLKRTFHRGRNDWRFLLSAGHIPTVTMGLIMTDEDVVRDALKFIFLPENIQVLPWGTCEVKGREVSISFHQLSGKRPSRRYGGIKYHFALPIHTQTGTSHLVNLFFCNWSTRSRKRSRGGTCQLTICLGFFYMKTRIARRHCQERNTGCGHAPHIQLVAHSGYRFYQIWIHDLYWEGCKCGP